MAGFIRFAWSHKAWWLVPLVLGSAFVAASLWLSFGAAPGREYALF